MEGRLVVFDMEFGRMMERFELPCLFVKAWGRPELEL